MTLATEFGTPDRIIRMAALDAQLVARGQSVNSLLYQELLNRLNDIINVEQTQGAKVFLLQTYDLQSPTLAASKATYTFGPGGDVVMSKPLRVEQISYINTISTGQDVVPLFPLSWNEYMNLSTRTNTGVPSQYLEDKQSTLLKLTFWLVPDATTVANGYIQILFRTQATNPLLLTDSVAFPQEWFIYLRWALAADASAGQPQAVQQNCQKWLAYYKDQLEGWDVEDAPVYFQPDMARGTANRGFR